MEKEMEAFSLSGSSNIMQSDDIPVVKESKVGHESNETSSESSQKEKGSKKKKGKSAGHGKSAAADSAADDQEYVPTKSKKNQRKGKDTASIQASDTKSAKKDSAKTREDNLRVPSEEWVIQKIMTLNPDFEDQGWFFFSLSFFLCSLFK